MHSFKNGDIVFHTLNKKFGMIAGSHLLYQGKKYQRVYVCGEKKTEYWAEKKLILITDEKQKLELILRH